MVFDKINLRGEAEWWKDMIRTLRTAERIHLKATKVPIRQGYSYLGAKLLVALIEEVGRPFPGDTYYLINESWETEKIRRNTSLATLHAFADAWKGAHRINSRMSQTKKDPFPASYEKWLKAWMPPPGPYDTLDTRIERLLQCCFNAKQALELELPAEDPTSLRDKLPGDQRELVFSDD